jgi:hypothetical protein
MLIAQYLKNAVFIAFKPPTVGPEFIKAIQTIHLSLECVLKDMQSNPSLSLLDALISEPSFSSPFHRLLLDSAIDVRCGDIGYLTGPTGEPRFIRLGNILNSKAFIPFALANLDSERGVDLDPEDSWSIENGGENNR